MRPSVKLFLLADLIVVPTGGVEFRQDVFSTGVGFGAVAGKFVRRLGFDHCQHEISGVAQKIISPFARTSASLDAHGNNAAVGETFLLADLIVVPAGSVQFRQDVLSTAVGFSDHANIYRIRASC